MVAPAAALLAVVAAAALLGLAFLGARGWYVAQLARGPTVVARGDGSFDWYPRGQEPGTRGVGGGGPRFRYDWEDVDAGRRAAVRLTFHLPDETAPRTVDAGVRWGLRAATWTLPGRAKARARGAVADVPGPESRVDVRLELRGFSVDEAHARDAAEAFARAFLWRVRRARRA